HVLSFGPQEGILAAVARKAQLGLTDDARAGLSSRQEPRSDIRQVPVPIEGRLVQRNSCYADSGHRSIGRYLITEEREMSPEKSGVCSSKSILQRTTLARRRLTHLMKLLFIGGTGIISSACAELAVQRGIELDLLVRGNWHNVRPPPAKAHLIQADIRKPG